ncbi:MAG: hypothetical protein A2809_03685 [Candidatus Muproteobacteria bacterium RIFCSPHIGHO2_01_FULL_61_200]|nr:MAG: hypothetical protein A2809_03685 [Candidatus Muproteobacteria bacterium RIFCSPHIGHO2_01_FULL_61_200]
MNQSRHSTPESDVLVDIRDIHFMYGDRPILKGITLPIRRGKVTAIMGGSGCGKTTLMNLNESTEDLRKALVQQVRKEIGPTATPDVIQWAPSLPKTRSGKIMRRILRKIAANELDNLGDTTTLADPSVVEDLVRNRAVK